MRDSGLEEGHGEDRTQSRHTLNSLSLSFSFLLLLLFCVSARPNNVPFTLLCFHFLSLSSLLSYLYHTVPSINLPLCVSDGVGRGPHSVSHSSSINDQLEHGATQSPPTTTTTLLLTPPAHTYTHIQFQLFLPPLKTSQHFFIYSPSLSVSLSTSLSLPVDISPKAHHTFS